MIIVSLSGGMGNQMFQYAFGRFLSLKYHTSLKLDLTTLLDRTPGQGTFRNYDLDIFNVDASIATQNEIPLQFRTYLSGKPRLVFNKLRHKFMHNPGKEKDLGSFLPATLSLGPDAYLEGYWQNENYFSAIADVIRKDFTFKNPFPQNVSELVSEIRSCESLCIHVRRTDYVGNTFTGTLGQEYYDRGIEYIKQQTSIQKIYVFSDDIDWCEQNLRFDIETTFVGMEYAGKKNEWHLALMSACKYFIIPNSTFSWWAAWLNTYPNKIVVAPKHWLAGTSIAEHIIPKTWIRL